jgi:hypothetical protein
VRHRQQQRRTDRHARPDVDAGSRSVAEADDAADASPDDAPDGVADRPAAALADGDPDGHAQADPDGHPHRPADAVADGAAHALADDAADRVADPPTHDAAGDHAGADERAVARFVCPRRVRGNGPLSRCGGTSPEFSAQRSRVTAPRRNVAGLESAVPKYRICPSPGGGQIRKSITG